MIEIRNARIRSTHLGFEGHGILSAYLELDYGDSSQSFGGYDHREGGTSLARFVQGVLRISGVESWEKVAGSVIRAEHDSNGVYRIGHITDDKWFDPKKDC